MTDTATPEASGDKLASLGGMTQETDAANPTPEQQAAATAEQAQQVKTEAAAKEWGMVMFTLGGFACMLAPELQPVYSQARCFEWGQNANAVAEKYGWNSPAHMPELALLASTAGFAVPTYFAVRAKLQEAREGKNPSSLLTRIGLWWRTRKARKQAADMADPAQAPQPGQEGQGDGRQQ